jgi:hypothetical protein
MNTFTTNFFLPVIFLFILAGIAVFPAEGGMVKISNLEYPGSPETLSPGETVPVVVTIEYRDMAESTLVLHIKCADDENRGFPNLAEVTISGTGSYVFPPVEIKVFDSWYWTKYITEWNLQAEIWKTGTERYIQRDTELFTLFVENPLYKPELYISNLEYVFPPDTIAVGEQSLVRVHTTYSNLEEGTKIEAILRDQSGILASRVSRALSGSGDVTFEMTIKPRNAGTWKIEATLGTVSGSLYLGDKDILQIMVVNP